MDWIPQLFRVVEELKSGTLAGMILFAACLALAAQSLPEPHRSTVLVIAYLVGLPALSLTIVKWGEALLGPWWRRQMQRAEERHLRGEAREATAGLSLPERVVLSCCLDLDQRALWLPHLSAVDDLVRKNLLVPLTVVYRPDAGYYQIPGPVWDYLRSEWPDRLAAEELQGPRTERIRAQVFHAALAPW